MTAINYHNVLQIVFCCIFPVFSASFLSTLVTSFVYYFRDNLLSLAQEDVSILNPAYKAAISFQENNTLHLKPYLFHPVSTHLLLSKRFSERMLKTFYI